MTVSTPPPIYVASAPPSVSIQKMDITVEIVGKMSSNPKVLADLAVETINKTE